MPKSTPKSDAAFLKKPAVRRFMSHQRKVDEAWATVLDALIKLAKKNNGSLYDAARDLTAHVPEARRAEAHAAMLKVVDRYRCEMAERAMWPNGNCPAEPVGKPARKRPRGSTSNQGSS